MIVQFGFLAMALSLLMILTAVPFAIIERRLRHRGEPERVRQSRPYPEAVRFIREHVSVTKFGDRRRITAPVAEILRPETGPIETLTFALKDPYEQEES